MVKKEQTFKLPNGKIHISIEPYEDFADAHNLVVDENYHSWEEFLRMMDFLKGHTSTHIKTEIAKWALENIKHRDDEYPTAPPHFPKTAETIKQHIKQLGG